MAVPHVSFKVQSSSRETVRRKQGEIAAYLSKEQRLNWRKDSAEPLQDQRTATEAEMLLRA